MSENNPAESIKSRGWVESVSHFLTGELRDKDDLLDSLRELQVKNVIGMETLSMIEGVLQVSEMRVRDIMIPRSQMVVMPKEADLSTIFPLVIESAHSRFPVINEDRSEVVGVLLAKDLLAHSRQDETLRVEEIMRVARFIPESKRLNVLLNEFRTNRNHMAIVVDEYGEAAGLVTIEDVLEQIVGEIEDEHDQEDEVYIFRRSDRVFTIKAITPISEFNEYFYAQLDGSDVGTMGGLVVQHLKHLPRKGEKITIDGFDFDVIRADSRRVHMLQLKLNEDWVPKEEGDHLGE
ncbi:MAG: transporter associated domain-containing protein [Methylococcales bacterium]|nr:transporter associated domain-containing protein [Methylococcales bacterium]